MLSLGQLQARKSGLGGSDIAAVLGLSPYKNVWDVYFDKTRPDIPADQPTALMQWGNLLEEGIADGYVQETGLELETCSEIQVHPQYPYLLGSPDRLIKGQRKGLEIKNVSLEGARAFGLSGSQTVPVHYYLQVMHYLMVMDYEEWDLAALIGGNELRVYTFKRNPQIEAVIIKEATNFWKNHVEPQVGLPAANRRKFRHV